MSRDIVEVLREAQLVWATHHGPDHSTRYGWAADEIERLRIAIAWALGEEGDFQSRQEGDPPYWWRTKLRELARGNP